jgi:hypothetical protein
MGQTITKPDDQPTIREQTIEQTVPTTQELYLIVNKLSDMAVKCYPGSIHADLCRDALMALTDELLRRRQQ